MNSKTNAMRILDSLDIEYNILGYEIEDGKLDGVSVSDKIDRPYENVFKTLVTRGEREVYVFIIPVKEELDFKKAAKIVGEKKIEMVKVDDILKITGYIRGGCSPIAMRREYKTLVHESAKRLDMMVVSGGKIGSQIELTLDNLEKIIDLELGDFIK